MAENIQAALAEFKNSPLKEPLKLALKNLEELAKDGLTPAEVAGFIAGAKDALSKAPENVLTPAQKAAATKLLDEFSNNAAQLTKVDGASAATAINGFVEMLDADTEEKAKEAARRSQAAAPDFFQMIIGAILTMLGFTEEQVAAFTGQTAAAPTAAAPTAPTAGAGTATTAPVASAPTETVEAQAIAEAFKSGKINVSISNGTAKGITQADTSTVDAMVDDTESAIAYYTAKTNVERLKTQNGESVTRDLTKADGIGTSNYLGQIGAALISPVGAAISGRNDHSYLIKDKSGNLIPIVDYYGIGDDISQQNSRANGIKPPSFKIEDLERKLQSSYSSNIKAARDEVAFEINQMQTTGKLPPYDATAIATDLNKKQNDLSTNTESLKTKLTEKEALLKEIANYTSAVELAQKTANNPDYGRSLSGKFVGSWFDAESGGANIKASAEAIVARNEAAATEAREKLNAILEEEKTLLRERITLKKEMAVLEERSVYAPQITAIREAIETREKEAKAAKEKAEAERKAAAERAQKQAAESKRWSEIDSPAPQVMDGVGGQGANHNAPSPAAKPIYLPHEIQKIRELNSGGVSEQEAKEINTINEVALLRGKLKNAETELHTTEHNLSQVRGALENLNQAQSEINGATIGTELDKLKAGDTEAALRVAQALKQSSNKIAADILVSEIKRLSQDDGKLSDKDIASIKKTAESLSERIGKDISLKETEANSLEKKQDSLRTEVDSIIKKMGSGVILRETPTLGGGVTESKSPPSTPKKEPDLMENPAQEWDRLRAEFVRMVGQKQFADAKQTYDKAKELNTEHKLGMNMVTYKKAIEVAQSELGITSQHVATNSGPRQTPSAKNHGQGDHLRGGIV